jgi:hypothetical protein
MPREISCRVNAFGVKRHTVDRLDRARFSSDVGVTDTGREAGLEAEV